MSIATSDGGDGDPALEIELLYQQLRFTQEQFNLSWSIFDKDTIIDDIEESSTVFASTCDLNNATVVVNTTDTTTVFSTDGYQDAFFNITAFNETGTQIATMDEPFRLEPGGKISNFDSCNHFYPVNVHHIVSIPLCTVLGRAP